MFEKQMKLPSVKEVQELCPLVEELKVKKAHFDEELAQNMQSRKRFVLVCGPCSADNPVALLNYCEKLKALQERHPNLLVVARVYTAKPHSANVGYKGLCFQKSVDSPCNLTEGIVACRKMILDVLKLGLPVADELLYPELYKYFSDIVSYWFVGARSSEDALHRGVASGLDLCCGVKNATSGVIENAVLGLKAVASPCVFPFEGCQTATKGNRRAHLVLRGGMDKGGYFSNIDNVCTARAKRMLRENGLNDFVMADLSHANSGKVAVNQLKNAKAVADDANVDGAMVESYLFGGVSQNSFGVSKTDDCLSFEETAELARLLSTGFEKRLESQLKDN